MLYYYALDTVLRPEVQKQIRAGSSCPQNDLLFQYEPFVIEKPGPNGTFIYSGLCIDILNNLAEHLNFK